MKYILIVGAIVIVGLGFMVLNPSSVEPEIITELVVETVEVPVDKIVYEQVIKEVAVIQERIVFQDIIKEVVKEVEVEKIVYRECEPAGELKVESISTYPNDNSVKIFLSTNMESEAFLRVWPAYYGFDSDATESHILRKGDLKKNTEYYYQITLITEDGLFLKKNGDFYIGN